MNFLLGSWKMHTFWTRGPNHLIQRAKPKPIASLIIIQCQNWFVRGLNVQYNWFSKICRMPSLMNSPLISINQSKGQIWYWLFCICKTFTEKYRKREKKIKVIHVYRQIPMYTLNLMLSAAQQLNMFFCLPEREGTKDDFGFKPGSFWIQAARVTCSKV